MLSDEKHLFYRSETKLNDVSQWALNVPLGA